MFDDLSLLDSSTSYFLFSVLAFDKWCSLTSSPEKEELRSVPLVASEDNLVKGSLGEELETTHLNEIWNYPGFKMIDF